MADDKKEKSDKWDFDVIEGILIFLLLIAIVGSVIPLLFSYLTSGELSFYGYKLSGIFGFLKSNVWFFKVLGFVAAGAAAIGTFVYTKMADAIFLAERAALYPTEMPMTPKDETLVENQHLGKWQKIVKLSESENTSDWRLAIIEADIMLDELLEKLKLPGDTMGEKLKVVEKSDFTTIESAWEAHKARNMIAHEGSDFLISQREVRRIISLYEAVFKEFRLI